MSSPMLALLQLLLFSSLAAAASCVFASTTSVEEFTEAEASCLDECFSVVILVYICPGLHVLQGLADHRLHVIQYHDEIISEALEDDPSRSATDNCISICHGVSDDWKQCYEGCGGRRNGKNCLNQCRKSGGN
jgi:hypothetical protein